jgi:hypothetical protein
MKGYSLLPKFITRTGVSMMGLIDFPANGKRRIIGITRKR